MSAPAPSTPELLAQLVNAFRQPPTLNLPVGAAPVRAGAAVATAGVCHFFRLAAVEAQLVLQFLDTPDKLRAARSCKRLHAEAATPFAWRHTAPLFIPVRASSEFGESLEVNVRLQASRLVASPLLRHAPTHLALLQTEAERCRKRPLNLRVDAVTTFPQVVELDGRCLWLPRSWTELLRSTAALTARLRALHVGQLDPPRMALVARLPSLRHLCFRLGSEASFAALLPAPALTSLSVDCKFAYSMTAVSTLLSVLRQCDVASLPLVRSLELRSLTSFPPADFASLCALPLLTRLTSLTLRDFHIALGVNDEPPVSELVSHLCSLPLLHTLRILQCVDDGLLREVAALSSLRRFVFLPAPLSDHSHPSHAGWLQLHASRPERSVELVLPRCLGDWLRLCGFAAVLEPGDSRLQYYEQQFRDLQQWRTLPHVCVSDLRPDAPCCA